MSEPLLTNEMNAMSGVIAMECVEEKRGMIKFAKLRQIADETTANTYVKCWDKCIAKASDQCSADFTKLVTCLDKNPRRSLKCREVRRSFEECYVKNIMLKEEAQSSH